MSSSPHLILAYRAFGSSNGNLQWQELVICLRECCSAIYEAIATQWQRAHVCAMVRLGDGLRPPPNDPSARSERTLDVHLHRSDNLYNMQNIAIICDQLLSHVTSVTRYAVGVSGIDQLIYIYIWILSTMGDKGFPGHWKNCLNIGIVNLNVGIVMSTTGDKGFLGMGNQVPPLRWNSSISRHGYL